MFTTTNKNYTFFPGHIMATVRVSEQKVILTGEYGVGKTSLFRRFCSNTFTNASDRQSTLGLDHTSKVYHSNGKDVKVIIFS